MVTMFRIQAIPTRFWLTEPYVSILAQLTFLQLKAHKYLNFSFGDYNLPKLYENFAIAFLRLQFTYTTTPDDVYLKLLPKLYDPLNNGTLSSSLTPLYFFLSTDLVSV